MKKIALLPGGFKPPHAGHYNMAKYLAKETNADVVVVKVGAKEREGVTREMSMQLWNLYKESDPDPLSDKLLIQPSTSNSPVRDVYDFIEDTAPEGSMVYLGMGEKDTSDSRFANIGKFAEPRNIQFQTTLVPPQAGGVSGTEMRGFIKNNQETFFFNALPDHLSEKDKQEAWDIVAPQIDEDLYDPDNKVSDYMKSSEWKAGMPNGSKKDINPSYKFKRGGLYGRMYEHQMTSDDWNKIGDVLRDSDKTKQIHTLLLQMFPQQKDLLNYNYENDSYAEFKKFIYGINTYSLEGPSLIQPDNLKIDPEVYKEKDKKYNDYIKGKIDKYFRDNNNDPRELDLTKLPPITIDENNIVMDGNHRAFLAIKQQQPLKGYKIVNKNNTHPNVEKILNIINSVDEMMMGMMTEPEKKKHNKKMKRLSKDLKKQGNQYEKVPSYIKGTLTRKMNEQKLFSKNWWKDILNEVLLSEGGAAGHMAHPFDLPNVTSGRDLVNVFEQAADSLQTNPGAVKIDGVNSSIRLVDLDGKKQFVMDRGSKKPLDIKGITKDDLLNRFGDGHGMVKVGGNVLDMFNAALPAIQGDLEKLGAFNDPNILFNMEYVSGKTNVQDYGSNFIAIHGLNRIEMKDVQGARGPLTKRVSTEVNYNKDALQSLLNNLAPIAKKRGFEVYGSVPTEMTTKPNFRAALSKRYTVENNEGADIRPLGQWLEDVNNIPVNDFIFMNVGSGKKKVGAVSKQVYLAILKGGNVDELFEDQDDKKKAIDGFATYLGTEKLGDEVLKVLDSPMGSVENHEGVVIRDEKISSVPFKITGKFILGGLQTGFR